jgi:hypothetical protein
MPTSDPAMFHPAPDVVSEQAAVEAALACVEAFTDRFNARDLSGIKQRSY